MKNRIYIFFTVILILSLNLSCNTASLRPEDFHKDDTVYLPLISGENISLNPLKDRNCVMDFLFERLVEADEKGEIIPNLLREWSSSSDGLTWRLKIRDGISWSDSVPLCSDDVVFTINYLRDRELSPSFYKSFEIIEDVREIDELALEIKLKEKYVPFPVFLYGIYPVPKHSVEKCPENFFPPVCNGPFTVKGLEPESFLCMTLNDKYWKKDSVPHIKNVVFRRYEERENAFQALMSGEIDILDNMEVENFMELRKDNSQFHLYDPPGSNYTSIGFNFKNEIFKDREVRQAISYAIDREIILHFLLHDAGEISTGPLYPFMEKWYRKADKYPYDREKAKKLLEDAGWHRGDRGVFEKDGKYLYFKLATYKGNSLRERVVTLIQQFLGETGIAVETEFMEWEEFLSSLYSGKLESWCADIYGAGLDPDNLTYYYFYSGLTPEKGGNNFGFYSNPRVDELLLSARQDSNPEKRVKYYYELQDILGEDLPVVFLYHRDNLIALNKRIKIPDVPGYVNLYGDFYKWKIL